MRMQGNEYHISIFRCEFYLALVPFFLVLSFLVADMMSVSEMGSSSLFRGSLVAGLLSWSHIVYQRESGC